MGDEYYNDTNNDGEDATARNDDEDLRSLPHQPLLVKRFGAAHPLLGILARLANALEGEAWPSSRCGWLLFAERPNRSL